MTFLHFGPLWFLLLLPLPILLHLLTLHRLRTVELSTYRFLFDSYVQQRRRMRFLEALLAMLRTLFILFLVVMVCRPAVEQSSRLLPGGSSGGRDVLVLVDCSASMNARSGGKTAMERAKTAASAIVGRLGREDRLTLVRVTARPEEVFSRYTSDVREVRERLEGLQVSSSRADVHAAMLALFGRDAPKRSNPVVYFFTDCQATGWREARDQGLEKVVPAGTPFYVVNVAPEADQPNQAVLGDAPKQNRAIAGLPFALQPRVVNYSRSQAAELTLGVFLDEKEVFRTPLSLRPGETASPRLPPQVLTEPGVKRGRFEISSRNPDRFPDDDVFRFTLHVVPRVRVLLVNGNPAADAADDEAYYLKRALMASGGESDKDKPDEAEFRRTLDVRDVAEPALTADTLRDVSVVVLANCGKLTPQQTDWLRDHVWGGGGLLIFPGDKVTPDNYNQQLFPAPQNEQLTAARLGPPEGNPDDEKTFERFEDIDFSHPALSVFNNPDPKERHFTSVRIYRRFRLTLPEKKGNARPIVRFSSGDAALVQSRHGDGLVILSAFPAHARWGNLPVRPDFVPLVLRLAAHVARAPDVEGPSAVVADGRARFSVSRSWEPVEANVRGPSGAPTPIKLEPGPRLTGLFEHTAERGYYTLDVRSNRSDAPRAESLAFAVNLAPEESSPAVLKEDQLRSLLSSTDFHYVDASAEAAPLDEALGGQREFWRPTWVLVLLAIIALEFWMATTSGRGRRREDPAAERGE